METVFYDKKYRQAFIDLNLAWIEKYFVVEPQDAAILEGVDKAVADGAGVFFVLEDGVPISTCMDLPKGGGVWEICKLAADEAHRGKGAGEAVLRACMEHAAANGAKKLTIVSNSVLGAAMGLYAKAGFKEVPVDDFEYERVNIQFELEL